ncbi:MAG TPA: MarR family winged helix-turn-helix transcriptional regulator [Rhizomicrobium sp.]|nr:MarR family winged helix-turn-helix transcriptional regulator [Rhizomicrobium sp.]
MSIPEWRVMAVLGQTSGLSAGQVARRTEMDKVQVSRAVTSLVRRRRVQRAFDTNDGRVTRLALTARGRAIHDEIVPQALDLEEQFLAILAPEERAAFDRLIGKLSGAAHVLSSPSAEEVVCEAKRSKPEAGGRAQRATSPSASRSLSSGRAVRGPGGSAPPPRWGRKTARAPTQT